MLSFTSDQWVIVALIFVLGLLIGGFLFSGGGRKWKTRYNSEVDRREELERTHTAREKEWREQDSLRGAAAKDRNRDGIDDRDQVRDSRDHVADPRGRDRDHDGIPDDRDPRDDRR
ncbi:MAG: hypothetical protein M3Q83_01970 [Pseudomonadota bacterium]|nr:hypothetical protein [Pseudomonadota bacterium]